MRAVEAGDLGFGRGQVRPHCAKRVRAINALRLSARASLCVCVSAFRRAVLFQFVEQSLEADAQDFSRPRLIVLRVLQSSLNHSLFSIGDGCANRQTNAIRFEDLDRWTRADRHTKIIWQVSRLNRALACHYHSAL